jgi:hypothetical protein
MAFARVAVARLRTIEAPDTGHDALSSAHHDTDRRSLRA